MGVKRVSTSAAQERSESKNFKASCTKSELQLFEPVAEQISISEQNWIEITPTAPLSNSGPILFDIPAAELHYTDLYQSYFKVKTKVTRPSAVDSAKRQPPDESDLVAPVNAFMTSLFSKALICVQGVKVGSDTSLHPFISYIALLLSYSPDAKETLLKNQIGWYPDSDVGSNDFENNVSLAVRQKFIQHENEWYGKLCIDLANQSKLIPNKVGMTITLERSSNDFVLILDDTETGKFQVEITACSLFLRRVKLNPPLLLSIEHKLSNQPAHYPFTRMDARAFTIPTGTQQWRAQNLFTGFQPRRVVYAVLPQQAFAGSKNGNPFVFANHGINHVNFLNDSQSLLLKPLEPNFDDGQYMGCYWSLLRTMRNHDSGQALDVDYDEFKKRTCLFAVDLDPDPMSGSIAGSFSIETRFKKATTATLTGLVVAEFSHCMMINKNREVFCFDY